MRASKRPLILSLAMALVLAAAVIATAAITQTVGGPNPDRPGFAQETDDPEYLQRRAEWTASVRGIDPNGFTNPLWRAAAVRVRQQQERTRRMRRWPRGLRSARTRSRTGRDRLV